MDLSEQIKTNRELGASICQRLTEEVNGLGFASADIQYHPNYDDAVFMLIKDPYTCLFALPERTLLNFKDIVL